MIRAARKGDAAEMQDVERQAGALFASIGMSHVADEAPASLDDLDHYARRHDAWVWMDDDAGVVAYALVDVVDGNAHLEQITVRLSHHRMGLGRQLIEHVARIAGQRDQPALTLTTFRDVPWNAPYFGRLGFEIMGESEIGPQLSKVIDSERRFVEPRVAMRRRLLLK